MANRVPLTTAPGDALGGAIARWLVEETARDANEQGEADPDVQQRLADLGAAAEALDLVGAALAGIREALLGLPRTALRSRDEHGAAVGPARPGRPTCSRRGR